MRAGTLASMILIRESSKRARRWQSKQSFIMISRRQMLSNAAQQARKDPWTNTGALGRT